MTLLKSSLAQILTVGVILHSAASPEARAAELMRLDGSPISQEEIERTIPELMARVWLPGMSVAVVRDGKITYRQDFGVRDVRSSEPITRQTSFTGLSFSKTITAYLVMRLVEAGTLELDRPLHTYLAKPLPEYEFYADLAADTKHRTITARHVLSHTTGWPNWRWFTDSGTLSFLFEPGTRHSYSGEGFAYLQLALEEITGKGFGDLAREQVFAPLAMSRSSMTWDPSFEADYAEDHDLLGRPIGRQRRDEASAAGSLQASIDDYTRFLVAVMNAEGLTAESRDAMLATQVKVRHARMFGPRIIEASDTWNARELGWSLGFGRLKTPYGPAFFHTGNDSGSANYFIAWPEQRAAVVLMGNSNRLEGIAEDVVTLLTADATSAFDFLGYVRWDAPVQSWLRTLADGGFAAGRRYWEAQRGLPAEPPLDDPAVFRDAAEALTHFGHADDLVPFQRWRRELFPESDVPARELVRALIAQGDPQAALAELDKAVASGLPLDWFARWARALISPASVTVVELTGLAGNYETRRVELRGDRLFYGRDATPQADYSELIPMGEDTFVLEAVDWFRLRFERDAQGQGVRVQGLYEDGRTDGNERTAAPQNSND